MSQLMMFGALFLDAGAARKRAAVPFSLCGATGGQRQQQPGPRKNAGPSSAHAPSGGPKAAGCFGWFLLGGGEPLMLMACSPGVRNAIKTYESFPTSSCEHCEPLKTDIAGQVPRA